MLTSIMGFPLGDASIVILAVANVVTLQNAKAHIVKPFFGVKLFWCHVDSMCCGRGGVKRKFEYFGGPM